jgi:YhcN/YlaJ family sporulation lipoprotein
VQKKMFLPVAVLGLAVVTSACAPGTDNDPDLGLNDTNNGVVQNPNYRGTQMNAYDPNRFPGGPDQVRRTNNYDNDFYGAQDLNPNYRPTNLNAEADRLAELAADVDGVDSATTVIMGRTAYVGLDIDQSVSRDRILAIEDQVRNKLTRANPRYDIRVTSDRGFFRRIAGINRGLRNGDNYDRYSRDFQDLDRDMMDRNNNRAGTNPAGNR